MFSLVVDIACNILYEARNKTFYDDKMINSVIWFISFYNSKSSLGTQYQVAVKNCWKHEGVPLLDLLCF